MHWIKNLLIRLTGILWRGKLFLKELIVSYKQKRQFKKLLRNNKNRKKAFLLGTADYANLGDQAISMAQEQFINDHLKEYKLIRVPQSKVNAYIKKIKKRITAQDLIFFQGGGNMGNVYERAEESRRRVVRAFPENQIIFFPQTIYFTQDEAGRQELEKSRKIYAGHFHLTIIAREKTSYEFMKRTFSANRILLTPDMVFYLEPLKGLINKKDGTSLKREGAMLCFRQDLEGALSEEEKEEIIKRVGQAYKYIIRTDMIQENSFQGVKDKMKIFSESELVITDRLHAMIFAAVTGTPCIVFANYNHKITGTYEWIRFLKYIVLCSDASEVAEAITYLKMQKETVYDNHFALPYYKKIIEETDHGKRD